MHDPQLGDLEFVGDVLGEFSDGLGKGLVRDELIFYEPKFWFRLHKFKI